MNIEKNNERNEGKCNKKVMANKYCISRRKRRKITGKK